MSGSERVVLGLGSNRGDSLSILKGAIGEMSGILRDLEVSSLYLTSPMDYADQDDFYNMVATGLYDSGPRDLLREIQGIEATYGRDRDVEIPKGPRPIDIDIELFGERIVREPDLAIPHERMHERQFVLVPLVELLPESADPVTGRSYRSILGELPDQGVRKVGNLYGS